MQSTFKLARVKNSIPHFARVTVEAEPSAAGVVVSDQIIEPVDESRWEVSRRYEPEWIDAAVCGARLSGEALVRRGDLMGCCIIVVRVIGALTDTTEDDVACASALAAWHALAPERALPLFDLLEGRWEVSFP